MPQRLGGAILAVIAVVLGIYSGVDSWPWWLTALFSLLSLSGVILVLLPLDKKISEVAEKPTAFIRGDASGSSLDTSIRMQISWWTAMRTKQYFGISFTGRTAPEVSVASISIRVFHLPIPE